jgi:hypothetical protein
VNVTLARCARGSTGDHELHAPTALEWPISVTGTSAARAAAARRSASRGGTAITSS